ncbi:type I-E CRISPR-associated protein Cas7/Cse4/CasC [Agathobaculum sp. NSJ-28]|uniref:Type I-E CRISPR-associated protein Cas7/Cse4/CasC n=2 Tax=Agathobaculum TaxID=2048137 RepID=A0A923LV48_9FIRM|nr:MULTISPECIES: type I-E CRISPR-associated protein Cas7/Cse4/CasC [Butyricicoccaceae]MBC5724534.1 type I-E CRISPR-associated protein Cas7/Cse4/CasC [Agathobaculum faecis]WOC76433.1 type I-E CRISPR-associated protein Cas7/Cse4/CasC [Intestinibacillus sp. NTUH-41-i26]SCJ49514.1 CRISPR-associated protein Cas7/Cse4/CasC%2C subtype I-E/ECOLI [uncultured Butyricicoccus sp.]
MLYEIHMIKNYPPTNLNRDDTGVPKICMFGGAQFPSHYECEPE